MNINVEKEIIVTSEKRKEIQKRVLKLERDSYNQKEWTKSKMVEEIQKIIEGELNK